MAEFKHLKMLRNHHPKSEGSFLNLYQLGKKDSSINARTKDAIKPTQHLSQ